MDVFPYSEAGNGSKDYSSWNKFFTNKEGDKCPIAKCFLKNYDCVTPLKPGNPVFLSGLSTVVYKTNIKRGYKS